MNYRHLYHAGNVGDVVKHAVLALLLEHLARKPTPFFVLDSHAGIGRYDLTAEAARRTGEAAGGIGRVLAALAGQAPPPMLASYLGVVAALNPDAEAGLETDAPLRWYPGSPRLARGLMRPGDRLVLAELHPEDAALLKREFAGDPQTAVHHQDGWQALKAHLPPRERRGVVLIDPPYEAADEAERLVAGLVTAHQRWPTGCYAVWYPIKERSWVWRLHEAVAATAIPRILVAELTHHPEHLWQRLIGSGLMLINPPWQLDAALEQLLPWLHRAFASEAGGARVSWLTAEADAAAGTKSGII
jgi:23S rRNA (adenine2030-N6)-methyltransferase